MKRIVERFLGCALSISLLLALAACGGGGGAGSAVGVEMATVSGVAMKGAIQGALVELYKLKKDGTEGELLGTASTADDGSFSVKVPKSLAQAPLLLRVTGRNGASYLSESKGSAVAFGAAESFHAALENWQPEKSYAVTPLTEAAYQQLQKFITANPSVAAESRIVGAANARVAALFNLRDVLAAPGSDPSYLAALRVIDAMVEDARLAGATNTLQTMNLINQAFVDVAKPAYQQYLAALMAAAERVKRADASVAATVNAMVAAAANPPAEPAWADTTAPQSVANLRAQASAENSTGSSVALSWSPAVTTGKNAVAGYRVYRDGKVIASLSTTAYLDKPLAPQTGYRYFIVAFDAAGNLSALGAEVAVTTPAAPNLTITVGGGLSPEVTALPFRDITAPSAPSGLAASTTALDAARSSVRLTWRAATDAVGVTGYDIYRNGVRVGTAADSVYSDSPVTSGVTYSYSVIAFDAAGNRSPASAALAVSPVAPRLTITVGGQIPAP